MDWARLWIESKLLEFEEHAANGTLGIYLAQEARMNSELQAGIDEYGRDHLPDDIMDQYEGAMRNEQLVELEQYRELTGNQFAF